MQHNWQLGEVAKLLQKNNFLDTLASIHDFGYSYFQYKADGEAQLLRSPACAWKTRYDGIDCKSFSIIVGCLLSQLGIRYYIRKIKQPTHLPTEWTHVYVIVPVNQITGSLSDGYYTIDSTLPTMNEPTFIDFNDTYMDKLPHYGLNGSEVVTTTPTTGTTTDTGTTDSGSSSDGGFFKNWNWDMFDGWFKGPIDCWGGSAFSGQAVEDAKARMANNFNSYLNEINTAVKNGDMAKLSKLEYSFRGNLGMLVRAYHQKRSEGWNSCTTKGIDNMIALVESYRKNVEIPLLAWLSYYFDAQNTGQKAWFSNYDSEYYGYQFSYTDPSVGYDPDIRTFYPKPLTEPIKAFEWTPYLESVSQNNTAFNIQDYLNGIKSILVAVQNTTGGNTGTNTDTGDGTTGGTTPTTQKAGFGVFGLVLTAAAVGLAVKGMSGAGTSTSSNQRKTNTATKSATQSKNKSKKVK